MGYVYNGPPQTLPTAKGKTPPPPPTLLQIWATEFPAMTLGDTCTITASGARVCTSDVAVAPVPVPLPITPAPVCAPCPPPRECLTPAPCPPCATPIPVRTPAVSVVNQPVVSKLSTGTGFARYAQLAAAARARMLQGLGDECQVYANGARVCNAPGPAPAVPVPQTMLVCTDQPSPISRAPMPALYKSGVGPGANMVTAWPARTRRICRQVPIPTPSAAVAVPYTTSTVAPVDNTTLPPAPVPLDTSTATSAVPSFDFSTIPSWALYLILGGGVYFLFFRR